MKKMWNLGFVVLAAFFLDPTAGTGVAPLIKLNTNKEMPAFGIGTWLGFDKNGGIINVTDEDTTVEQALGWAIDAGYRHIDTAAIYKTEAQVGRAVRQKIKEGVVTREELFITTKLWNYDHSEKSVIPALRASLSRLGLDYVDLYLVHWPVAQYNNGSFADVDYLETWKGMLEAKAQNLTKSIGVSNFNKAQLERLIVLTPEKPAVLQVEINLNLQQPELRSYCKKHNIAVMAYSPFGSIFHNRAAPDAPPPRTDDQKLLRLSKKYNKTVPQIVLRYLVELGVVPIPKSVTKKRIEENIQVFDFNLTREEKDVMRDFDKNYRTISVKFWENSPYYPFEKTETN